MRRSYAPLLLLFAMQFAQAFDQSHAVWDGLLERHVVLVNQGHASQLDYAGMLTVLPEARRAIAQGDYRLDFLPYDWGLNDVRK
jgi:hypothetical protein